MGVEVVHTVAAVRERVGEARSRGRRIGLVPTMGALHAGHGRLIEEAHANTGYVVVSVFVNPLQFGPTEDLDRYPRTLVSDSAFCRDRGADLVFAPSASEMYPSRQLVFVEAEEITSTLCGASRPGHFRGVATVVTKLLNIVSPDVVYFGQKDAQQAAVIRRMIADLNFPVEMETVPTVREKDGLAMSSRNSYLSPQERKAALVLFRSLQEAEALLAAGEDDSERIRSLLRERIGREPLARIDYVEVVDPDTVQPLQQVWDRALLAVAAYFGATRLIDNVLFERGKK